MAESSDKHKVVGIYLDISLHSISVSHRIINYLNF